MMGPTTASIIAIVLLLASLAGGIPVAFGVGLSGVIGLVLWKGMGGLALIGNIAFTNTDSFILTCVPLFLLMAQFLRYSGIATDLFDIGVKWLGRVRGGLAMASVAACAGMGAMSGSSSATAATIGSIAIPEMNTRGYSPRLSLGSVASAGTIAILIPPSVPMIIYGSVTETSVGKLFMAGMLPGIMLAFIFITYIGIAAMRRPGYAPPGVSFSWREMILSLRKAWTVVVLMGVVLGTIYAGVCTPTEAAAIGAFTALTIGGLVYRGINRRNFVQAVLEATKTTTMILMIVVGAMIFGYMLSAARIPQALCEFIASLAISRWLVLIGMNILLLLLGCFLDVAAIILITMPIIFPIVSGLGFDPVWFGILVTINMEMAMITPPFGLNLFIIKGVSGASMSDIIKGIIPFFICAAIGLAIVMAFPQIALWLPGTMK